MSAHTDAKAKKLIAKGRVAKVADGTWQVLASNGTDSYFVQLEPRHCDCLAFRFRKECAHIHAVDIMAKSDGDNDAV